MTPRAFCSANFTRTEPNGASTTHASPSCLTSERASPAAHRARFRGSERTRTPRPVRVRCTHRCAGCRAPQPPLWTCRPRQRGRRPAMPPSAHASTLASPSGLPVSPERRARARPDDSAPPRGPPGARRRFLVRPERSREGAPAAWERAARRSRSPPAFPVERRDGARACGGDRQGGSAGSATPRARGSRWEWPLSVSSSPRPRRASPAARAIPASQDSRPRAE